MRRSTLLAAVMVVMTSACVTEEVVQVERSGCLSCHRPLKPDGTAHGIEEAHPPVDGDSLTCVACHGGDPDARKQSEAHVSPGLNGAPYLRNLTTGELDEVNTDYLRFINPGDYRVAKDTCGSGAGAGCHQELVEKVVTNQMATFSGELGVARYRAGMQNSGAGTKAVYEVRDESFVFGQIPGTVGILDKMAEPRIEEGTTEIGPYQDLYLTKACMRCHTWSFGDNKFPGDFRSSGCTSCHMHYADDGLSQSDDPTAEKGAPPHPKRHVLTTAIPTEQCTHCHYRGGRIGPSFQGYRESAGAGQDSDKVGYLGEALHGHDANYYIIDEDLTNSYDETPPDVHFQAGMDCVDCHTDHDVHGDGHIYVNTEISVEIRCEDCHGTAEARSTMTTSKGNVLKQLSKDELGQIWLKTKVSGASLRVAQVKDSLDNSAPGSFMHQSMGRDESGFSHMDSLACHTCHSAWIPTCYGCHVEVDMRGIQRSLISGVMTPGKVIGDRRWVATDDLILMLDTRGRIAPSMPAEKMFFTAYDGNGDLLIDRAVRQGPQGQPGMGHRTFNPHTIQRWSPFMRCDRCHLEEGTHANKERVDQAMGLGTDRYIETDGAGKTWRLDQVVTDDGGVMALIGHKSLETSQPLTLAIMDRMLGVEVPGLLCPTPSDVAPPFSLLQDTIFTPSCALSQCHNTAAKAGGLDLSPNASWQALVNRPAVGQAGQTLAIPGDSDGSYLVQKVLAGGDFAGKTMPPEGPALEQCQIDMIISWIADGAAQ